MAMGQKTITTEEKKRLVALLAEMKARGIPLPEGTEIPMSRGEAKWGVDSNGYFIKRDGKLFKPREELEAFINSRARFILLRSGRGGSKTTAGAQKALKKIREGKSGAVMNPDFENFRTSTWPELKEWLPWDMVVPKQRYRKAESWEAVRPFTMVFMNGARMYCKGLKDPESARGSNVNWFWYDEGRRDPTGLGWKNAIAFCRVGFEPQAWCTTTPAHSLHWTSKFFNGEITPELQKILEEVGVDKAQKLFEIYETGIERNKDNLDPMFYASILAAYPSGYLRAREVEGRVADEEGSLGDRSWFDGKVLDSAPDWIVKQVRFWDLAATEQKMLKSGKKTDPDETMGTLQGTDKETQSEKKRFCIIDQVGGRWLWSDIKRMVVETARKDGPEVAICFEQEPASGGKNQVAELKEHIEKELPEWSVYSIEAKKLGDRVLAANTWFGEAAPTRNEEGVVVKEGRYYMVRGLWNKDFLEQLDLFPNPAVHDDRITSVTGGRHYLAPIRSWKRIPFTAVGFPNQGNQEIGNSEIEANTLKS